MIELSPAARRLLDAAQAHDGPSPRHRKALEQKIARAAGATALTWAAQAAADASVAGGSTVGVNVAASTATNVAASTATNVAASTATNVAASTATNVAASTATNVAASTATNVAASTATNVAASTTAAAAGLTASSVKGLAAVATAKTLGGAAPWLVAASLTTALATPLLVQSSASKGVNAPPRADAAHPGPSAPVSSQRAHGAPTVSAPPNVEMSTAEPAPSPVTASTNTVSPSAPRAPEAPSRAKPGTTKAAPENTADRKDSVALELALLGKARTALRTGDGVKALTLLDEHARSFAGGQLSAERQAVRILALCSLGRNSDAQQIARRFFAQHPHSPLTQRIHSSCVSERNPDPPMTGSASPGNE